MTITYSKLAVFISFCCLFFIITACTGPKTEQEIIEKVEHLRVDGELGAAAILIKDKLQTSPESFELRKLLAEVLASYGDIPASTKEYQFALENSRGDESILQELVYLLRLQEQNGEIILLSEKYRELFEINDYLTFHNAMGLLNTGDILKAKILLKRLSAKGESSVHVAAAGFLSWLQDDLSVALELFSSVQLNKPFLYDAFITRVKILIEIEKDNEALTALKSAPPLTQKSVLYKILLANVHMKLNNNALAREIIEPLQRKNPNIALANQLSAYLFYKEGNFEQCAQLSEKSASLGMKGVEHSYLKGLCHYAVNNYERALQAIRPVMSEVESKHPVNNLLVAIGAELDDLTDESFTALMPLHKGDLRIALSEILTREGELEKAAKLVETVVPNSINDYTQLSKLLNLKEVYQGINRHEWLDEEVSSDGNSESVKVLYYLSLLNTGQSKRLLSELENQKVNELPPVISLFKANALVQIGKTGDAERVLENLLEYNDVYFQGYSALSSLYDKQGSEKQLIQLVAKWATKFPLNYSVLKYALSILPEGKSLNRLEKHVEQLYLEEPSNSRWQTLKAFILFKDKNFEMMKEVLALSDVDENTADEFFLLLITSIEQVGDVETTVVVIEKWLSLKRKTLVPYQFSTAFFEQNGLNAQALSVLNLATENLGDSDYLVSLKINTLLNLEKVVQARKEFSKLSESLVNSSIGKGLLGRILFKEKRFEKALPLLIGAYNDIPSLEHGKLITALYLGSGQILPLRDFLNSHIQIFPNDIRAKEVLASLYLNDKADLAIRLYNEILSLDPDNADVMNNLSWLYKNKGKNELALELVERAISLNRKAEFLHTKGVVLIVLEDFVRASEVLKEAYLMSPSYEIVKEYAAVLSKLNRSNEIRRIIEKVEQSQSLSMQEIHQLRKIHSV